jgi:hypothetical protein
MAWIQYSVETRKKPEVRQIARMMGVSPVYVVGVLVCLWADIDPHARIDDETGDAEADFGPSDILDFMREIVGRRGKAERWLESLIEVGWLRVSDDGVALPNYASNAFETAKERAERYAKRRKADAERQAKSRAKNKENGDSVDSGGIVTPDVTRDSHGHVTGQEKRIGEDRKGKDKDTPHSPPRGGSEPSGSPASGKKAKKPDLIAEPPIADTPLDTEAFREAWSEWHAYRKERGLSRWTPRTVKMQIKELTDAGHDDAIASIKRSIAQGWAGLFPAGNRAAAGGGGARPGRSGTTANGNPVGTYDEKIDLTAVTKRYGPPR